MRSSPPPLGLLALAGLALVVGAILLGPKTPLTTGGLAVTQPAQSPSSSAPTARILPSVQPSTAQSPAATPPTLAAVAPSGSGSAGTFSNVTFEFFAGWTPEDRSQRIAPMTLWRSLGERIGRSCRIEIITGTNPDHTYATAQVWVDCVLLNLSARRAPGSTA